MSSYQADSFEEIRRRLEEIKAERNLALTGSSVDEPKQSVWVGEAAIGWPFTAYDDLPAA